MCFSEVLNSIGLQEDKFGWGGIGQWIWEECGEGMNMIQKNFVRKSERTYKNEEK